MTKRIDFEEPETYDQLEAIGGLYRALFMLSKAYGLEKPYELVAVTRGSVRYDLQQLLEKQNKPIDVEKSDDPDAPIDLSDIHF